MPPALTSPSSVESQWDVYTDANTSLDPLLDKTVAIIGYGNQGTSQAQNLRDSGISVVIGARPNSVSHKVALSDGFIVAEPLEVLAHADVAMLLTPDEILPNIYESAVLPVLAHKTKPFYMGFGHGLAICSEWIQPEPELNVFMVAPKGQGRGVRRQYQAGSGVPSLVAVQQDFTGDTWDVALAYGKAIGSGRVAMFKTTFKDEAYCDLFTEQSVLCGGLTQLIKSAYEVLIERGYDPKVAYFECLYEVKLIADLIFDMGITGMREKISPTALFGDITEGPNVIGADVKHAMQGVLDRIESGEFARAFLAESEAGRPTVKAAVERDARHPIEQMGEWLRAQGVLKPL